MKRTKLNGLLAPMIILVGSAAAAQEAAAEPALIVELNAAETTTDACRLSFLIRNEHAEDISGVIYETVLFGADGGVQQLTLFDFGALPSGRPRVRQFEVTGLGCADLGSILINGATTCDAGSLDPAICDTTLNLRSRTDIAVLG